MFLMNNIINKLYDENIFVYLKKPIYFYFDLINNFNLT